MDCYDCHHLPMQLRIHGTFHTTTEHHIKIHYSLEFVYCIYAIPVHATILLNCRSCKLRDVIGRCCRLSNGIAMFTWISIWKCHTNEWMNEQASIIFYMYNLILNMGGQRSFDSISETWYHEWNGMVVPKQPDASMSHGSMQHIWNRTLHTEFVRVFDKCFVF